MKRIHQQIAIRLSGNSTDSSFIIFLKKLLLFGWLQAISCIFPVIIFVSLAFSSVATGYIPRYELLLIICILAQVIMYKTGLETKDEVYVISMFHILGLVMELHKVHHGSWSYPDSAYSKFLGVPLYSGFMYASVGSYICQAWRNLQLTALHWPKKILAIVIGAAIYLNFITNAYLPDLRLYIIAALIIIFWRTKFSFTLDGKTHKISAILSFILIGFFIWLAENIATFFGAWRYAYQHNGWQIVEWHKITSWSLLVIVSIIIVGQLKIFKKEVL
ncbi:DUF817 domain-containing protein [Fulvivirga sediminis]|uniref:DUF817 domain-containing protein n=1 Tax=Fulvivirga sediminis TaxID=2803949 RepID=A0A937F3J5_9BACT|nr:DUF817 domain-containing protein [Fulvivirga sediminis]MBL3655055.1 DUF817 domain-containing protein [Fulvivirga sediminis]